MGEVLIVILDILGARKLVDHKKILIGYTTIDTDIYVHELLVDNPRGVSSRRNGLEISQSSFVRIVKYDLMWHPYKMRVVTSWNQQTLIVEFDFLNG